MNARALTIGGQRVGNDAPLCLIAGPCQLEGLDHAREYAETLNLACEAAGVGFIFEAAFDKSNRTSLGASQGPGKDAGLETRARVKAVDALAKARPVRLAG